MKRIIFLLSVVFSFTAAYSQNNQRSTGFKQLEVSARMLEDNSYWSSYHQLFMRGRDFNYACITCPSFEPESCLLIADSVLTLISLDHSLYSYIWKESHGKPGVIPTAATKSLPVSKRFASELCWLIDLGSLTADAYQNERMLDGSCTYFFANGRAYRSSKTRADGKGENGNEASQVMKLLNLIKDAVAGKSTLDEENVKKRIHQVYRNIFAHVPTWYTEREFYDIFKDADKE